MSAQPCTCDEVIPLLDAYHDGELSGAEESLVSSHLVSCSTCPSRLKEIESLVGTLQGLPKLSMSKDLTADLAYLKKALDQVESPAASLDSATTQADEGKDDVVAFSANKPLLPRSNFYGPLAIAAISAAAAIALFVTVPPMLKNQQNASPITAFKSKPAEDSSVKVAADKDSPLNQRSEPEKIAVEHETAGNALARANSRAEIALHEHHDAIHNHLVNDGSLQANLPPQSADDKLGASDDQVASKDATATSNESPSPAGSDSDNKAAATPTEIASAGSTAIMPSDDRDPTSASSSDQPEILAAYPTDSGSAPEELGLSTDEDGLYAFKM